MGGATREIRQGGMRGGAGGRMEHARKTKGHHEDQSALPWLCSAAELPIYWRVTA
jgi:hypothetical protein